MSVVVNPHDEPDAPLYLAGPIGVTTTDGHLTSSYEIKPSDYATVTSTIPYPVPGNPLAYELVNVLTFDTDALAADLAALQSKVSSDSSAQVSLGFSAWSVTDWDSIFTRLGLTPPTP